MALLGVIKGVVSDNFRGVVRTGLDIPNSGTPIRRKSGEANVRSRLRLKPTERGDNRLGML